MTRNAREIFAAIDGFVPADFVAHLTEDVVFRYGNADPVVGRDAVRQGVAAFFSSIAGLTHHIQDIWDTENNVTVVRIDVEYRRHDGETVYIPNLDVLRWRGDLVTDWQIVIDIAPIYTPIDQVPKAVLSPATAASALSATPRDPGTNMTTPS